jgi:hypothetical protein
MVTNRRRREDFLPAARGWNLHRALDVAPLCRGAPRMPTPASQGRASSVIALSGYQRRERQ